MNFEYLHPADQLVMIMHRIYARGMTTTSGGNLSIQDTEGNIWITPAGIDKGTLTRADIICVKPDGACEGIHKPSSELPVPCLHLPPPPGYPRRPACASAGVGRIFYCAQAAGGGFDFLRAEDLRELSMATYAVPGSDELGKILQRVRKGRQHCAFGKSRGMYWCEGSVCSFHGL